MKRIDPDRYVSEDLGPFAGLNSIRNLDGVSWSDAPRPRRFHRCWAQTVVFVDLQVVCRCPCGAISRGRHWTARNS